MKATLNRVLNKNTLLLLILIAIALRIIMYLNWSITTGGDSNNYLDLANHIKSMNLKDYSGLRTPGYPLIIILAGFKFNNIVILQLCMGIIISVCLYKIMYLLSKNRIMAFLAGLIYAIYLPFIVYEFKIVTETTSILFFTLTMLFLLKYLNRKNILWVLLISIFSSIGALTRPELLVSVFVINIVIIIFIVIKGQDMSLGGKLLHYLVFLLPIIIILGSWIGIIHSISGKYQMSTLPGLAIFQKADFVCFDKIPTKDDDHPKYKSLYLKYCEKKEEFEKKGKDPILAIWNQSLEEDMIQSSGLSKIQISELLGDIGKTVLLDNMNKYMLKNLYIFIDLWRLPVRIQIHSNPTLAFIYKYIIGIFYHCLVIVFLIYIIIKIFSIKYWVNLIRNLDINKLFILSIILTVILTSISVSILIAGYEGPRRNMFIEPLILLVSTYILYDKKRSPMKFNHRVFIK